MEWSLKAEDALRQSRALAEVDGRPTSSLADRKDDLEAMLSCCDAEEATYWRQAPGSRISAAPLFFERAAIILSKRKQYTDVVTICDRWVAIADDYRNQPMVLNGSAARCHLGPRAQSIEKQRARAISKLG